jgi:amino acid transporter
VSEHRIGVAQGTALYVGAVLGAGALALPTLAAAAAGPASVLAWAGLIALSVPVAAAFAALGRRYPDGGGVATFVARAAGPRMSAAVGWWFYFAVPAGAPAAALVGGQYVSHALGWGHRAELAVAAALLVAAFGSNCVGLRLSGRLQLLLVGMLALLLAAAIAIAAPHARLANLTPFAPHGWPAAAAAVLLTFGTMNAYIAGASRLGAALGRDGALPAWLSRGGEAGQVPRRSLSALAAATTVVAVVAVVARLTLGELMLAASACFVAVTLAGLAAAVVLLRRRTPAWWGAVVAAGAMAVVLAFSRVFLAWPLALLAGALVFTRRRRPDTAAEPVLSLPTAA